MSFYRYHTDPLKLAIWALFFTQPFWGHFLPTSIPFWTLVIAFAGMTTALKRAATTAYESLLLAIVALSLLGWMITGSFAAHSVWESARNTLQNFVFAAAILVTVQSEEDVYSFLYLGFLFAIGTGAMSLYSLFNGTYFRTNHFEAVTGFERAGGWIGIPNSFAPFLVLSLIMCWYRYKLNGAKIWLCLAGVFILMLLTTLSRNAILGAASFFLAWSYLDTGNKRKSSVKARVLGIGKWLCGTGIALYILYSTWSLLFIQSVTRDISLSMGTVQTGRLLYWQAHFRNMMNWNFWEWLFGIGYENLGRNLELGLGFTLTSEEWFSTSSVENGLLSVFLGSGLCGLGILILLGCISVRKSLALLSVDGLWRNRVGVMAISSMCTLFCHAMLMDFMYLGLTTYYYVLMGLPVRLDSLDRVSRRRTAQQV